jgi:hypothetical protein
MPLPGFEFAIPACERPRTHALDRAATGIGMYCTYSDWEIFDNSEYLENKRDVRNMCADRHFLFSGVRVLQVMSVILRNSKKTFQKVESINYLCGETGALEHGMWTF